MIKLVADYNASSTACAMPAAGGRKFSQQCSIARAWNSGRGGISSSDEYGECTDDTEDMYDGLFRPTGVGAGARSATKKSEGGGGGGGGHAKAKGDRTK